MFAKCIFKCLPGFLIIELTYVHTFGGIIAFTIWHIDSSRLRCPPTGLRWM